MDELLKYAIDNGMIDLADVKSKIEMKRRKEYLQQHTHKIWQSESNGMWMTYLVDSDGKRKRIKRRSKIDLEDAIVEHMKEVEEKPLTFDQCYWKWRSIQDEMVASNTTVKYDSDYKRYFMDTEFTEYSIDEITEEDVKVFIVRKIKEKSLCKKASKTLFGYMNNTFKSAMVNRMITENPMRLLEPKNFYKHCTEKERPQSKTIINNSEIQKLNQQYLKDFNNNPQYLPTYAVRLASITGMRVGEIAALRWDRITNTSIIIDLGEVYVRKSKEYIITTTKNGKKRAFPLTDEAREILNSVKKIQYAEGVLTEWVFANRKGRIHANVISSCLKNKCRQVGITEKGIHAYRRTVNSKMRCNGVSSTVAASLLGHTQEVNEQYYTFDISTSDEKFKIVEDMTNLMSI